MGLQIALFIASLLLSAALTPKPPRPKPAMFSDIDFPLSDEGEPMTAVFGQCWTPSWQVLTVGNYRTRAIKSDGGKK